MSGFDDSFLAMQRSFKPLKRNAIGDDGKPYADIEAVWTYIRPRLAKHGFVLFQSEGADAVTTVIRKGSDYMRFDAKTEPSSSGPNRYGRRHALMCMLGLVEEPIAPAYRILGQLVSERLYFAIQHMGLSVAQYRVILNSGKSDDEMINEAVRLAEAQRLGGGK